MKNSCIPVRFVIFSTLLLFLVSSAPAQQKGRPIVSLHTQPAAPTRQSANSNLRFSFGSVRSGQVVRHTFTLHNTTGKPVMLTRFQSTCSCLMLLDAEKMGGKSMLLPPQGVLEVGVALDTTQIPEAGATTLSGADVSKQVWAYAEGDSVHPFAILEMRGRITHGVSFTPAGIEFGSIDQAKGATRTVTVKFDANLFEEGRTRLTTVDSRFRIEPMPGARTGSSALVGGQEVEQLVRSYRIVLPPHTPVGPLSGVFRIEGLKSPGNVASSAASSLLPYAGQVIGTVRADPGLAVFGLIRPPANAASAIEREENMRQRTRWILLTGPSRPPRAKREARKAHPASTPNLFWSEARVQSDNPLFEAVLVSPARPKTAAAKLPRYSDAPPIPQGTNSHTVCWLRIRLSAKAPRKKPLSANMLVTFANGERLRIPALAQQE